MTSRPDLHDAETTIHELWPVFLEDGLGQSGLTAEQTEDLLFAQSAKIAMLTARQNIARGDLAVSEANEE